MKQNRPVFASRKKSGTFPCISGDVGWRQKSFVAVRMLATATVQTDYVDDDQSIINCNVFLTKDGGSKVVHSSVTVECCDDRRCKWHSEQATGTKQRNEYREVLVTVTRAPVVSHKRIFGLTGSVKNILARSFPWAPPEFQMHLELIRMSLTYIANIPP